MSPLPDFRTFFQALWGYDPFPWQEMLAARTAAGRWLQALDQRRVRFEVNVVACQKGNRDRQQLNSDARLALYRREC